MEIRPATPADGDAIWSMLEPAFRAGDSYAIDAGIRREDGLAYWLGPTHRAFLAHEAGAAVGTFYLRANQGGNGDHVCNAGFVTGPAARGRGVARAMLERAFDEARARGYAAMQFNFVVETNTRALAIWTGYGFDIVGRVPQAFRHPQAGLVDALILHRFL